MSSPAAKKFFGCFSRRERWGLSLRGWLILLAVAVLVPAFLAFHIQPFLARNHPVNARILVVEGWVPLYAARVAAAEFRAGHYDRIYTTGGPITGTDGEENDYNTLAYLGVISLTRAGLPASLIHMVPSRVKDRDRTYGSALALREYFRTNGLTVDCFNLLTLDVHARRSCMLFQQAFGTGTTVGVIAVPNPDYVPARWWRYSEGVRSVISESIAWAYAAFLFHPDKPAGEK